MSEGLRARGPRDRSWAGRLRLLRRRLRPWAPAITVVVIVLAALLIRHILREFTWQEVVAALHRLPRRALWIGALCAAGSYFTQTGFDAIGVRYGGMRLSYPQIAVASFTSLSIGHSAGLAPTSALRYRIYSRWGLRAKEVGLVMALSAAAVLLGELSMTGVALIGRAPFVSDVLGIGRGVIRALGVGCLVLVVAYGVVTVKVRRQFEVLSHELILPTWRMALGQVALGTLNFGLMIATLHVMLEPVTRVDYLTTAAMFTMANLTALVTHAPGGIGVFEATFLLLLPTPGVAGALIAFRAIYYLIPLLLGLLCLAALEFSRARVMRRCARPRPVHPRRRWGGPR